MDINAMGRLAVVCEASDTKSAAAGDNSHGGDGEISCAIGG